MFARERLVITKSKHQLAWCSMRSLSDLFWKTLQKFRHLLASNHGLRST
jgi:hypothetical protein